MRITIHGHRPACLNSSAAAPGTSPTAGGAHHPGANPSDEAIKTINLGFIKLKVHRQTARQASLLAQLRPSHTHDASGQENMGEARIVQDAPGQNLPEEMPGQETTREPAHQRAEDQVHLDHVAASRDPDARAAMVPTPAPQTLDEYLAHWNEWARAEEGTGGNRIEAVERMRAWLVDGNPSTPLILSRLQLTSLPEYLPSTLRELIASSNLLTGLPAHLPKSLEILDLEDNRLSAVPENLPDSIRRLDLTGNRLSRLTNRLPASLEVLDVGNNLLTALPDGFAAGLLELDARSNALSELPGDLPNTLLRLVVSQNQLSELPETLPESLCYIDASGNRLTALPSNLPAGLQGLDIDFNRIRDLPENLLTVLGSGCIVSISNNQIPQEIIQSTNELMNATGYEGPSIIFSSEFDLDNEAHRSLADAVAHWYPDEDQRAVRHTWTAFAGDAGADDFSKFLDGLAKTIDSNNPRFNQATTAWLTHLAADPDLRKASFLISNDAATRCEDRISLTFNEMKKARVAADVENGRYDEQLPELIEMARGMFRLDQLQKITRNKVSNLRPMDEIGVHLAYQVKLRTRLNLPLEAEHMRFFNDSRVTQEDLDQAAQSIQEAEEKEFLDYLATDWKPWQSVLQRLHKDAYIEAQTTLVNRLVGDEFEDLLNAKLAPLGLQHDSDARTLAGAKLSSEIAQAINRQSTLDFLSSRGLLHLLGKP